MITTQSDGTKDASNKNEPPFMAEDRAKRATGVSHPIDVFVGNKIRQQRTLLGFSQGRLGAAVGLTFQQVQKYERGANRVGASRLYEISRVLKVPVAYFFDGLEKDSQYERMFETSENGLVGMAEQQQPFEHDPFSQRETLELVRAYYSIEEPAIRRKLFELAKSMSMTVPTPVPVTAENEVEPNFRDK
ncbi:MAG: helix-turn-helix domain-containing protein [Alphaproteobacteria bacterium]